MEDRRDPAGSDRGRPRDPETETDPDPVELGVALLERLEHAELSVAEAIDRIEAVTTVPGVQREILETAERRGVIERSEGTVRPTSKAFVRFESQVVTRDGDFECERCGAALSTGYFIRLEDGEVGPYGSSCVRKVTGRE